MSRAALVLALLLCWAMPVSAQGDSPAPHSRHEPAPVQEAMVGVVERIGEHIADDVMMRDEQGRMVNVRQLITMPTILAPVYYACPTACNLLLGTMSQALPQVGLKPGKDFQVISVSFDETEGPALASQKHRDYTTAAGKGFPPEHWRFLTGEAGEIKRLLDSVGFHFMRQGDQFKHPVVLIAISPSGMITRYLYGATPLPFDLAMAATEAAGEKAGASITRALAYCYTYDPQGRRYVFNLMGVAGVVVLMCMLLFVAFLAFGARKRRQRQGGSGRKGG